jgi:hypothetical protein
MRCLFWKMNRRVAAAIIVLVALSAPVGAAEITDFTNASNFPAKVQAIHFNNTIDPTNSTTWGAWTVSFGSALPVATMNAWAGGGAITMQGLRCTNAVVGSTSCSVLMWFGTGEPDEGACRIDVDAVGSNAAVIIPIACPRSLELAQ